MTRLPTARDEALCALVEQYQAALLRVCYMYLRDRALAEDAVQESFIKAYRTMDSFRGECSQKTWLMRIAVNTCRDMLRSAWFKRLDRRITPEELPQAAAPQQEHDAELALEVMRLPRKLKDVVLLYYYQNLTMAETADALGISQSSVSVRLTRARSRLRAALERGAIDE